MPPARTASVATTFQTDTVSPVVAITAPAPDASVKSPVRLTFTATDATSTIASRTCAVDGGEPAACVSGVTFALSGGDHTIRVEATDQAGNSGDATVSFSVATLPTVMITSPSSGAVLGTTSASLQFETANEPTSVTCKLDAAPAVPCASPQDYADLAEGTHTVRVYATNAAGTASVATTFKVDTIAPVVAITAPAPDASVKSSVRLTFTATDATERSPRGPARSTAASPPLVSRERHSLWLGGDHLIRVTATDLAGNPGSATVAFNAFSAPVVSILSPSSGSSLRDSSVAVAFTATEEPTSYRCKLDAAAATTCSSPHVYSALSEGPHTVIVSATNANGTGSGATSFKSTELRQS